MGMHIPREMKWLVFLLAAAAAAYRNMYPGHFPEVFIEILDEDLIYSSESSEEPTAHAESDELSQEEYEAGLHAARLGARWAALTLTNATTREAFHSALMRVYAQWSDEYNVSVSPDKRVQCDTMTAILTDHDYYIPDGYNDVVNGWLIYCP